MGSFKKEAARKERTNTGDGMNNVKVKGENFYRSAKKVKVLNMFRDGKPQRNASGDITKAAPFQSREKPSARVEPNRKWFTNTRVISQDALTAFRGAVAAQKNDPYSYLMKQNKLPMSLIRDDETKNGLKQHQAKIAVETAPFKDTFGPKAQRKRPKLAVASIEDMIGETSKSHDDYEARLQQARYLSGQIGEEENARDESAEQPGDSTATAREPIFSKGQSKRIWNELYKVIDSSDVIIHVLDARDPDGTRCRSVEKYMREEAPHKHLLFVLNKCDLIPTSVAATWVRTLSKEYPTLAFHASINNSFGKGSLISLLRQFSALHSNRKQISVGFIGYPNTGKSSIINTLRKKKVCTVAPIPGETKVWQYITLMKRIYLIDCPGVVPPNMADSEQDILLRGVVRVENVENPEQYIPAVLARCKRHHLEKTYEVKDWTNAVELIEALARKGGRLLKGGEADASGVAKMILNDFMRGKIPWYVAPVSAEGTVNGVDGRDGKLGEMSRKRKRGPEDDATTVAEDISAVDDDDFSGFSDEDDSSVSDQANDNDEESVEDEAAGGVGVEEAKLGKPTLKRKVKA